ncbi:hypothetical protein TSOC_011091 [Tetrabaena socialis]|uniref:Uncharacterized protein n=1 Tax=Tetrabaena socialis TaxID=47790 RepID=A0A2J7ZRI7_9CHLO|nr:hypothetical protein TSOC_011091 [Tetrabaena socialis]|eukprot:PNH02891.1 hypothetical protein TSOC_011091 [Tetrabaena socialis]
MSSHTELSAVGSLGEWVPSLVCTIKRGEREGSPFAQHSGKPSSCSVPVSIPSGTKFRDIDRAAQHSPQPSPTKEACACSPEQSSCQPGGCGTGPGSACGPDEGTIRDGVSRLSRAQSRAQAHSSCGAADPSGSLGAVMGCARSLSALAVASMLSVDSLDNLCNALSSPLMPPHASLAASHAASMPAPGTTGSPSAAALEAAVNAAALAAFSCSMAAPADSPRAQQQRLLQQLPRSGSTGGAAAAEEDRRNRSHAALMSLLERLEAPLSPPSMPPSCSAVAPAPSSASTASGSSLAGVPAMWVGDVGQGRRRAVSVRCTLDCVPPRRGLYEGTVRGGSPRNSWRPCAAGGVWALEAASAVDPTA